ncbi:MAG: hypothetical protein KIT58_16635 [Planctomycetota bacterium]|nr:hypothetical protein [Planctomycetota bacterium]
MEHTIDSDASIDPDSSQGLVAPTPLPFVVQVVVAFLVVDALERAVELASWVHAFRSSLGIPRTSTVPNVPVLGLWVAVNVLLVFLLLMRTRAGRLFTAAVFVLHAFYLAHVLVVSDSIVWLYMSDWGRARLALSVFVDGAAVVYLLGGAAAEALDLS